MGLLSSSPNFLSRPSPSLTFQASSLPSIPGLTMALHCFTRLPMFQLLPVSHIAGDPLYSAHP